MTVKDAENGSEWQVDTSSKYVRQAYQKWWSDRQAHLQDIFRKSKVDTISVSTDDDYVKALINLFNLRS
jgi:hypothetical protein